MMKYIMTESKIGDTIKQEEQELKTPREKGFKEYGIGMISVLAYMMFIIFAGSNLLKTAKYFTTPEGVTDLIRKFPLSSDKFAGNWTRKVEPTSNPFHFVINSIVRTNMITTNYIIFKVFDLLKRLSPWESKIRGGVFYLIGMPMILVLSILLFVLGPLISIITTTESIVMDVFDIPSIINKFLSGEIENFISGLGEMESGQAAAAAAADAEMVEGAAAMVEGAAEVDVGGIVMIILACVAAFIYFVFVLIGLGTVASNSMAVFLSVIGILTFYTNYSLRGSLASWGMAALLSLINFLSPFGIGSLYQFFSSLSSFFLEPNKNKKYNPAAQNMEVLGLLALLLSIITAYVNLDALSATSLTLGVCVVILYIWFSN